jgi:hypothetical protein
MAPKSIRPLLFEGPDAGKGYQIFDPFIAINAVDAEFLGAPKKALMAFYTTSLAVLNFLFYGKNRTFNGHKYGNFCTNHRQTLT